MNLNKLNERQLAIVKAHIESSEKIFWMIVLVVGKKITTVPFETKWKFWRDGGRIGLFIALPFLILELLYPANGFAASVGLVAFAVYLIRWRRYLKGLD